MMCLLSALQSAASEVVLIPLIVVFGLGMLAFVGYAWLRRDQAAKLLALLTLAWSALLFLLMRVSDLGGTLPGGATVVLALSYLLIPGAYLLFGQGRWIQARRVGGAVSTGIGTLSMLSTLVILALVLSLIVGCAPSAPTSEPLREAEVVVEEAVQALPTAPPAPAESSPVENTQVDTAKETPRLRQYFPETLYWAPEVVTDESGFASLEIPMADSITTWRLTALASSQDGRLGFTTRGIRVFQDFFVDIDLPVSLTQGDEISIPVGVFNYLPKAQDVRLEVKQESWFELLGEAEQTLTIASNDIEVVYFPIRVIQFGRRGFQVTAWGEQMDPGPSGPRTEGDAIRREVSVVPDGKEIRLTESDWLRENKQIEIAIPPEAVPETPYVEVKIYPGVMAQAVEGLEKILRLPHG
jgi:hypothetical protein